MWVGLAFREGWRLHPFVSCALAFAGLGLMIFTHMGMLTIVSGPVGLGGGAALIVAAMVLADVERPIPSLFKPLIVIGDASYALVSSFTSFVPIMLLVLHVPKLIDPTTHPFVYCALIILISLGSAIVIQRIDDKLRTTIFQRLKFARAKPPTLGGQAIAP